MMTRFGRSTLAAPLLLVAIVGCSTPAASTRSLPAVHPTVAPTLASEPEPTFAVLDACAIFTKADAERIAGTPLESAVPGDPLHPSCTYTGPVTGPLAQVQIFIGDGAKKTYDIEVRLKHDFTNIAGLGDEAHAENNAIFVRKGTTWVAIELVRLNDPAENRKPLQQAAKKVIARMP